MNRLYLLMLLFFISGCVSTTEYNKLLSEHTELEQRYRALSTTSDYYFNEGVYAMKTEKYEEALGEFKYLISNFSSDRLVPEAENNIEKIKSISIKNYNLINETIKSMVLPEKITYINNAFNSYYMSPTELDKLEAILNELQVQYEKERYIVIREEPLQKCRFIETTRNCTTEYNNKKFTVELYMIENAEKERFFRVITKYSGDEWIFYEKVILSGLNNSQLEIPCVVFDKKTSSENDMMNEWHDYLIEENSSKVIELSESDKIYVTFDGKEKFSFVMKEEVLKAFKEIAAKF